MVSRLKSYLDPYILLMLGVVALAGFFPASGGGARFAGAAADTAIVFLFFLYGARLSFQEAVRGIMHWRLHLAVLACTFLAFPLLGLGLKASLPTVFPPALMAGIVFLCLLPSTVQSSIAFTSIAGGNVPAAVCAATLSNMLGVFLTPIMSGLFLGGNGAHITLDVFTNIMLQLLAPFVAGQLLRPWIGGWIGRNRKFLGLFDRGSILLIIYVAFSKGMEDDIWSRLTVPDIALLGGVLAVLLALVLVASWWFAQSFMRLGREDRIVLQFCGSKKSMASGLPMASVLFAGPQLGLIVIPMMLFHQMQLIVCAVLARHYAGQPPENAANGAARTVD